MIRDQMKANKGALLLLAGFLSLMFISQLPSKKSNELADFPKPDPNRGIAWGWDFKKQEYRYESYSTRESPPAKAPNTPGQYKSSRMKITSLEQIKTIQDLEEYTKQNQKLVIIYRDREVTEDEAMDILDRAH